MLYLLDLLRYIVNDKHDKKLTLENAKKLLLYSIQLSVTHNTTILKVLMYFKKLAKKNLTLS